MKKKPQGLVDRTKFCAKQFWRDAKITVLPSGDVVILKPHWEAILGVITTVESSGKETSQFEEKSAKLSRNAKSRALSLLRTASTSRYLPPSWLTSTDRTFPKHLESTPGGINSKIRDYTHRPDRVGKDSHYKRKVLACRWRLLSL